MNVPKQYNGLLFLMKMMLVRNGNKKAKILKKSKLFHSFGENCSWSTHKIPSEPYLISVGNDVIVCAGVRFITHDMNHRIFNKGGYEVCKNHIHYGKIVINDNVMIGADSIILYNTTIGSNVIIAAGSVVTKDVPNGVIVGGNPAKIIGKVEDLAQKRYLEDMSYGKNNLKEEFIEYFWGSK